MKQLGLLGFVLLFVGCQADKPTAPRAIPPEAVSLATANDDGPPSFFPSGSDTYRTRVFTGGGPKPRCSASANGGRTCDGFLRSFDHTALDVRLEIPPGDGPFALVALIHGYAGSKTSSGDIASALLAEGYAILRYSTRGFGDSWGQVNLADLNAEIRDLQSMIGQVVDEADYHLNPDRVAVAGASYGGGHSWLALVEPTFQSPKNKSVRIRAVIPIAPWSDLLYSLLPNGEPRNSLSRLGGLKTSYVNGLYASGIRKNPARPYPNYPDYLIAWHAYINATEPSLADPTWKQVADGLTLGRSIWWQERFWNTVRNTMPENRVGVFQVQGFTDDLFPLPEAKRMLLALQDVAPGYPITSYFGDLGHPRARNQPDEVQYVIGLIKPWLAYYLKGAGTEPTPYIYAARTDEPFIPSESHVLQVEDWTQLWTAVDTLEWTGSLTPLVNPVTFVGSGVPWDPFVGIAGETLQPYSATPPQPDVVPGNVFSYSFTPSGSLTIAGQPTVILDATVVGHRVQLNVRLIDAGGGTERLITRGTVTLDAGLGLNVGAQKIMIPTYGNFWLVPDGHSVRLEISNVDSPYLTPSREPSSTVISKITLVIPNR